MKKIIKLFFFLLFTSVSMFATHNRAGEIAYTHISGNTYHITVTTYTKASVTTADRCSIVVYFGDGDSAVFQRFNGPPGSCSSGAMDGEVLPNNIKKNVYIGLHTYPGAGVYTIEFNDPNYISGICNINSGGSVNVNFSLKSELVISAFFSPNSSPIHSIPLLHNDTVGVISNFNTSVVEADGDSLYYELIPSVAPGLYSFPPSSNSFSINSQTGTVTWDSPTMICIFNYAIKIWEYKNFAGVYHYAGYVIEEISTDVYMPSAIETIASVPLRVYPNPASNSFTIETGEKLFSNFELVDLSGQKVLSVTTHNQNKITVNTQNLSPGIYFYTIFDLSNIPTQGKIVINSNISE
jgi:hypothetical protein